MFFFHWCTTLFFKSLGSYKNIYYMAVSHNEYLLYGLAVSHKDKELPNSWIWLAETDIERWWVV